VTVGTKPSAGKQSYSSATAGQSRAEQSRAEAHNSHGQQVQTPHAKQGSRQRGMGFSVNGAFKALKR